MAVFSGNGSAASPSFTFSSDTDLGIFRAEADVISFTTDGTERARLDATGTLEIGGTLGTLPNITLEGSAGNITIKGDIINTVTNGDQDIICNGEGLVKLTEYNLNPMEVVTKRDIGTGAGEVPVNGFLGTLAYTDDLATLGGLTVANLPASPIARVGDTNFITDGADYLYWGEVATGGGTGNYSVWFNGTNWVVFGGDDYSVETWTPTAFTIGAQSPTVNATSITRSRGLTIITIQFSGSQRYVANDIIEITGIPVLQYGTGLLAGMNSGVVLNGIEGHMIVRNNGTARGRVLLASGSIVSGSIDIGCVTLTLTEQA
ncbi:MAG: hypothetical protein GY880_32625 [Planctomycetaceae bacterium]|nr:hypothetical protein [Planctomycetaceae bacterium]